MGIFLIAAFIMAWNLIRRSKKFPKELNEESVNHYRTKLTLAKLVAYGGVVIIFGFFLLIVAGQLF